MSGINGISSYANYALQFLQNQQAETTGYTGYSSTASSASGSAARLLNSDAGSSAGSVVEQLRSALSLAMDTLGLAAGDKVSFADLIKAREKMEEEFAERVKSDLIKLGVDPNVEFTFLSDSNGGIKVMMDASVKTYTKSFEGSETIKKMIEELDLDDTVQFSLTFDGKGGITASPEGEDAAAIERYLQENPSAKAALLEELGMSARNRFTVEHDGAGALSLSGQYSGAEQKAIIEKYLADNPEVVNKFNEIQSFTNLEQARKSQGIDQTATRKRVQMESLAAWFAEEDKTVDQLMQYSSGESLFAMTGIKYTA